MLKTYMRRRRSRLHYRSEHQEQAARLQGALRTMQELLGEMSGELSEPRWSNPDRMRIRLERMESRMQDLLNISERIFKQTRPTADPPKVSGDEPAIEFEYGCPADDLKAPPGWRFILCPGGHPVFRRVRENDWYLQAGPVLTPGTRGAMSAAHYVPPGPRLILERVPVEPDVPTVESKYGKPMHELCSTIPYGWRLKLVNTVRGGVVPEFRPIRTGDYYLTVSGGVGLASALDEAYDSHRLILERIPEPPRPRRWVLEETGKIRVPKAGEWSYMNGLPHCWRDDAHTSYQMLRQVEGPEPEPRD